MSSNQPSGHELDQFSPEAGDKPKDKEWLSVNISFDVDVLVPVFAEREDLLAAAERFRNRHNIKEDVSNVEENF